MTSNCTHCKSGWLDRGDIECVNGVLIDIDEAHEVWQQDVLYPPSPCQACSSCDGEAFGGQIECPTCNSTGWKSGKNESLSRLKEWRETA